MTEAVWAHGTVLKKGSTAIAELTNINGLNLDSDEIDVTHLESPGGYEEIIQSIRRTGVVSIEGNFVPGDPGQAALMADYLAGTVAAYTIDFSGAGLGAEWNFDAYVKMAPSTEAETAGKIPFSAELRVTGQPSLDLTYSGNLTDLSGIEQNTGAALTFSPTFAVGTYEYVVSVNTASTWVKFTVTGADTLTIDGTTVTTAVQSDELDLGAAGSVTKFVIARQETGKIKRRYTVHVARASA